MTTHSPPSTWKRVCANSGLMVTKQARWQAPTHFTIFVSVTSVSGGVYFLWSRLQEDNKAKTHYCQYTLQKGHFRHQSHSLFVCSTQSLVNRATRRDKLTAHIVTLGRRWINWNLCTTDKLYIMWIYSLFLKLDENCSSTTSKYIRKYSCYSLLHDSALCLGSMSSTVIKSSERSLGCGFEFFIEPRKKH